ncbi:hypothetical protein GCM10010286_08800 [Streptomyces toxytricini]|nr:hypothetical protein GCM10010286_08800 [Streptomyces toxytricini]
MTVKRKPSRAFGREEGPPPGGVAAARGSGFWPAAPPWLSDRSFVQVSAREAAQGGGQGVLPASLACAGFGSRYSAAEAEPSSSRLVRAVWTLSRLTVMRPSDL